MSASKDVAPGTRHDAKLAALHAGTGLPGHVLDVVVLTADAGLLATLRDASGPEHAIWHAQSAEAAVDFLVGGRCGILIADLGTLRGDAAALLDRLHAQFPELIMMATGRREEERPVAALVGDGRIYRFLHKPVSPTRANLFIGAATRRYNELRDVEPVALTTVRTIAARPNVGKVVAGILVALAALIAFFIWQSSGEPVPALVTQQPRGGPTTQEQIADRLARAQIAFASGRLSEPRGDNAIEYFRAVLALQPGHANARAGLDRVIAELEVRLAEALRNKSAPQGAVALTALQRAHPEHPQLDSLRAELVAISRSARPPANPAPPATTSENVIAERAGEPAPIESTESTQTIGAPAAEALAHRAAETSIVNELALAIGYRERGQLIEPAGSNAYDQLLSLREAYPDSEEIRSEQQRLALVLLERTHTALAAGELSQAEAFVERVEVLIPGMNATRTLRQQITASREQREFMALPE